MREKVYYELKAKSHGQNKLWDPKFYKNKKMTGLKQDVWLQRCF